VLSISSEFLTFPDITNNINAAIVVPQMSHQHFHRSYAPVISRKGTHYSINSKGFKKKCETFPFFCLVLQNFLEGGRKNI
jgi:hypothetical protein